MKILNLSVLALLLLLIISPSCKDELFNPEPKQSEGGTNPDGNNDSIIIAFDNKKSIYAVGCAASIGHDMYYFDAVDYSLKRYPQEKVVHSNFDGNWPNTFSMTSDEDLYYYALHNNGIYKLNPNGWYSRLGGADWPDNITKYITYLDGYLYVIHNNSIYRVNKSNGSYSRIGASGAWPTDRVHGFTALNGSLYIHFDATLYKVNPSSGSYSVLGTPNAWPSNITHGLSASHDYLYIAHKWPTEWSLYKIYPSNGSWTKRYELGTSSNTYKYIITKRLSNTFFGVVKSLMVTRCYWNKKPN